METKDFYNVLFDKDDKTCFSDYSEIGSWDGTKPTLAGPYKTNVEYFDIPRFQKLEYFVINPMHTARNKNNVTKFRNFLVEIDNMSIPDQKKKIKEFLMPYSTAVYSGGKSIHFIISLEEPLRDIDEYKTMVNKIYDAMGIKVDKNVDPSCKNATRFSRCPNSIRVKYNAVQHLLKVNARIPNQVLLDWLAHRGIRDEDYVKKISIPEPRPENADELEADYNQKYEWVMNVCMQNDVYTDNRHRYLYKVASMCNWIGMSTSETLSKMESLKGMQGNREVTIDEIERQIKHVYEAERDAHNTKFIRGPYTDDEKADWLRNKNREKEKFIEDNFLNLMDEIYSEEFNIEKLSLLQEGFKQIDEKYK
jgi:hypothetical protein